MTQSKKNCEYYFWCCDFYSNTGEGKLAHLFIYYFLKVFKKKIIQIRFNKKNIFISRKILKKNNYFISNKINFNFLFKYVYPFYGIFMLWINFFKNKKIFYINYLPLWNFFIFLLAPPTTNFGPITGAYYKGKIYNLNTIIRKYIFPILYRFSYFLLLTRNKKLFFSNNEFYELFKKKNHIDQVFNFQILYLYNKKIIKKKKVIDFLIYYRNHNNKNYYLLGKILKFFPQNKIFCIGDNLLYKNIKNLGVVSDNRVKYLLSKTKNTYITAENSLSFYCLDSILNSVIIFPKNIKFNTNIILKKKKSFSVYNINKKRLNYLHSHTISNLKKLF